MRPWWMSLLALAAGAALPLAFAPFSIAPLAILLPALLLALLPERRPRRALGLGYLFGLGCFGVGVSWVHISIHVFGGTPLVAAILVAALLVAFLALFPALAAWLTVWLAPLVGWPRYLLAAPAAWVLSEWLRGWLFTGFPWLLAGYTQLDTPLAGYAPVLGVHGVGLLLLVTAGALAAGIRSRRTGQRVLLLALVMGVWLGGSLLRHHDWTRAVGEPLEVSLVQGNIAQDRKWQETWQRATLARYLELSRREWSDPAREVDLVVWPETAIPAFYHQIEDGFLRQLRRESRQADSELLTGIPVLDREQWAYYNAVMRVGGEDSFYFKRHLVPFGEYLPLRQWLGTLLQVMPLPVADFSSGGAQQPLLRVAGHPVGVSICYEIIFGTELLATLPEARLLVNVSNDAWFGDSLAPHQHLQMARMRALEAGRELLRATNTGISAVIDHRGRLRERGPQFEVAVVRASAQPREGATPYVQRGDLPVLLLVAGMLALGYAVRNGYKPEP
ncbi:apolipoprotein N-acyltransferase [Thiohalobacter sp. COW1]|uniref:apolipoprotein N-acyltransferase n=1 Tax=Thiohalobacter sp. COW1 TaxID=2795687 RepID=UPI001916449C|nr:apolipoprotein N-acyltransferase [Thiohalobacter sp. COW1]BCO31571.1 apolipoprotein N-acyltransferase [Thiohalobacter sp. COW1]